MEPSTAEWITAISGVLAAVGTLAAVVLALWLQVWKEARTEPKVSLGLPGARRHFGFGGPGHYGQIEVAVSNAPDRRTARDVEVVLTASPLEVTVHFPPTFRDQPLRWVNHESLTVDVPPGVERRAVAMLVGDPRGVYEQARVHPRTLEEIEHEEVVDRYLGFVGAFPGPARVPADIRWIEPDIEYELWMTVSGADIAAQTYRATICAEHRGESFRLRWTEDPDRIANGDERPLLLRAVVEVRRR